MPPEQRLEAEAAACRRLVQHLLSRLDVQNIGRMNLADYCRNSLSKWHKAAADDLELPLSIDQAREALYGMPYNEWKSRHQAKPDGS